MQRLAVVVIVFVAEVRLGARLRLAIIGRRRLIRLRLIRLRLDVGRRSGLETVSLPKVVMRTALRLREHDAKHEADDPLRNRGSLRGVELLRARRNRDGQCRRQHNHAKSHFHGDFASLAAIRERRINPSTCPPLI